MKNTRFICFYSYKGGTGRSLALANIAYLLASNGQKVLIMDMDMEAPGQHKTDLFHEELPLAKPGLLELLLQWKEQFGEDQPFFIELKDYVRRSSIFDRDISQYSDPDSDLAIIDGNGCIDLLPVSQLVDDKFQAKLAEWDWELFYTKFNGEDFLQYLKLEISEAGYDTVLIDSRTGMSEVFFVSTFSLADTVVIVSSLNRQNIEGSALAAATLTSKQQVERYGEKKLHFVLSPVPQGISLIDVNKRIKEIKSSWKELKKIDAHIPYQPELALLEKILVRDDLLSRRSYEGEYTREIKKLYQLLFNDNIDSSITLFEEESFLGFKTINPFLAIRVEYWNESQVVTYFVDPGDNINHAMQQFMPTVLFGSRGTGKTMLARWLSYETMAYRLKNPKPNKINSPIGLWFRLDVDLLNIFNTKDPNLKDKFSRLFGQFFDLLVLRKALEALDALGGIKAWCNPEEVLFKVLAREMGLSEYPKNYEQMAACIEQCLAELRAYINNPERVNSPYLIQDNVLMKLLVEQLLDEKTFPENCYFIVLIDEYENFYSYQQRIVNTRVKQVKNSDRVTYKLLVRNDGIHTYETLASYQPIEVTHDFRTYNLDEGVDFYQFKDHVAKIIGKHLSDSRFFLEHECVTADKLFALLSAEDEALIITEKRGNQPLCEWLKKNHRDKNTGPLLNWMAMETNLLRQAVAVVLLNQGKSVEKIVEEFSNDSKTAKDWYHNYHRGALHWLCSLYKKNKRYAGFDQIVGIAGNNTRTALDLCHAIIEKWLATDEQKFLPIDVEMQNAAIHEQSETYFRALRERRNDNENYHRFVERLGRLFEIIHKGPRQGEPEINHFVIEGELDSVTEKSLRMCRNEAVLRWLPGNKQKGKADEQRDAWQLHPRYTPYFDISWRRKKMLKLTANEIGILFTGDEKHWKTLVTRVDKQYCKLNSKSPNQKSLFDEDYE